MTHLKYFKFISLLFFSATVFGQNTDVLIDNANNLYESGQYKQVIELLDGVVGTKEQMGAIEFLLGDSEHKMDDFENAISHYNQAERNGKKSIELYFHRSAAYISLEKYNKAIKDLNKAIELQPGNAELFFYRAYAYTELEKPGMAILDYNRAILIKPDFYQAFYNRGAVQIELENLEKGSADLEKAEEIGGDKTDASFNLAIISYEKKEYDKAINMFYKLMETEDLNQKIDSYYYLAECYYELDDAEQSCRFFSMAMDLGDKDSEKIFHDFCEKGQIRKLFKTRKKTEKVTF